MRRAFPLAFTICLGMVACTIAEPDQERLCGNGDLNYGEACDKEMFPFQGPTTCAMLGYNSPARLGCTPGCELDVVPCVDSGICGDGVMTPIWEACDGKDNGGETCESLGFHGGRLFCREGCQFDISQCLRCGDGVLQPEYGEVMESGPEHCLAEGFLGGSMYTEDCVTPGENRCGNYALLEPAGSAVRPVISLRPDGSLRVLAHDTGAYPGFGNPYPWCPLLTEVYEVQAGFPRVVGWRHDPVCEREFLATRSPDGQVEIHHQREEDGSVIQQMGLDDGGQIVLRRSPGLLWLERVSPTGHTVVSSRLSTETTDVIPLLWPLPGGVVGVSSLSTPGLSLAVFDPGTGAVRTRGILGRVVVDDVEHRLDPGFLHRIAWVSETEWWVLARLVPTLGSDGFIAMLRVIRGQEGRLEVQRMIRLPFTGVWWSQNLVMRFVEDRLELTWAVYVVVTTRVKRASFSTGGELLGTWELALTPDARVEAIFVEDDGSVVLAGVGPSWSDEYPLGQRCRPADSALFRWSLDPEFRHLRTRSFRTTAARSVSDQPDFCSTWARTYDLRDGTVVVAGAYSRREGFCSDQERPPLEKGLPVHTCGIYLVRFE